MFGNTKFKEDQNAEAISCIEERLKNWGILDHFPHSSTHLTAFTGEYNKTRTIGYIFSQLNLIKEYLGVQDVTLPSTPEKVVLIKIKKEKKK